MSCKKTSCILLFFSWNIISIAFREITDAEGENHCSCVTLNISEIYKSNNNNYNFYNVSGVKRKVNVASESDDADLPVDETQDEKKADCPPSIKKGMHF